jgi:hypothetical protein
MSLTRVGEMEGVGENLTLPLITRVGEMEGVGTSLNSPSKDK